MRWAVHVARTRKEIQTKFLSERLNGREHFKDPGVHNKIILEWILGKYGGKIWTGFIWLMTGKNDGTL
jgi:hypothetical protein